MEASPIPARRSAEVIGSWVGDNIRSIPGNREIANKDWFDRSELRILTGLHLHLAPAPRDKRLKPNTLFSDTQTRKRRREKQQNPNILFISALTLKLRGKFMKLNVIAFPNE